MTKPTKRGGPRLGSGPKVGPDGPADARLNIKCTKAELARYTETAKATNVSRSAWVKRTLNKEAKR